MSQSQKQCATVIALIMSEGHFLCYQPVKGNSAQRCAKERRDFIRRGWKRVAWGRVESVFPSVTVGRIELADEGNLSVYVKARCLNSYYIWWRSGQQDERSIERDQTPSEASTAQLNLSMLCRLR